MKVGHLEIDQQKIAAFCEKHGVAELSIFGSALREDFRPDSDVDVLFELDASIPMSIEKYIDMKDELETMFGREVDVVQKRMVTNPFRRYHILTNRRIVYVRSAA